MGFEVERGALPPDFGLKSEALVFDMDIFLIKEGVNVGEKLRSWVYFSKVFSIDGIVSVIESDGNPLNEVLLLVLKFFYIVSSEVFNLIFDLYQFFAIGGIRRSDKNHLLKRTLYIVIFPHHQRMDWLLDSY